MTQMLISVPDETAARWKAAIPARQRSKVVAELMEKEIKAREQALYECALAVENDTMLNQEMNDWDITLQDGVDDESW